MATPKKRRVLRVKRVRDTYQQAYNKEYYLKNRERILEKNKRYYQLHKDDLKFKKQQKIRSEKWHKKHYKEIPLKTLLTCLVCPKCNRLTLLGKRGKKSFGRKTFKCIWCGKTTHYKKLETKRIKRRDFLRELKKYQKEFPFTS